MTSFGKCMVCLVLNLTTYFSCGEGAIRFTKEPDYPRYIKRGNNATLVWDYSVTDRQTELKFITWAVYFNQKFTNLVVEYKNGDRVVHPDMPSAYKGRIGIEGRASLVIENITYQDSTAFQCTLRPEPTTGLQDHTSVVILIVTVPVQFTVFPQNVTVNKTNPVVLSCDASGFPEPSFTWTKDGQELSQSEQLNIQRSDRSDTGMYVCTASNGVGQDMTAQAYVTVHYPPSIKEATLSAAKSWIGQTVMLKCVSDGVPTPTLTWYKPNGSQINIVTATQNILNVNMSVDQDFGGYKCDADNGLTPADFKIVKIEQIKSPGPPTIVQLDIQATSLTVKWTAPAVDGGSSITAYRVIILKGGTEIKNENITDHGITSLYVGDLTTSTNYTLKVFARNAVFEGPAVEMAVKTKYEVC